jgi:hypothetical protein
MTKVGAFCSPSRSFEEIKFNFGKRSSSSGEKRFLILIFVKNGQKPVLCFSLIIDPDIRQA